MTSKKFDSVQLASAQLSTTFLLKLFLFIIFAFVFVIDVLVMQVMNISNHGIIWICSDISFCFVIFFLGISFLYLFYELGKLKTQVSYSSTVDDFEDKLGMSIEIKDASNTTSNAIS